MECRSPGRRLRSIYTDPICRQTTTDTEICVPSSTLIIRVHLVPLLGARHLDAITNEDVQRVKSALGSKSSETANNVLTVNTMLKKAVEWDVIDAMSCRVWLLPMPKA